MPDSLRSKAEPQPILAPSPEGGEAARADDLAERLEALALAYERLEPSLQARREALIKKPFDYMSWRPTHRRS